MSGNLFDQPRESTAQVDSNKTSQEVITEKVEDAEDDHQMSIASGEYDKQDESEVIVAPKKKEKKQTVKKTLS